MGRLRAADGPVANLPCVLLLVWPNAQSRVYSQLAFLLLLSLKF
jgi:hypothetical protein